MKFKDEANLSKETPPGRFYGPCSGRDLPIAFRLFGETIDRFTFCDLGYRRRGTTAEGAVPGDWKLISHIHGVDEVAPEKSTSYSGRRQFRPCATLEVWRRPDGSEALVELRRDLAQDVLTEQFAPGSIAAFIHINDGIGEGGSNLWFLAMPGDTSSGGDHARGLLPEVVSRLCNGALVVTGSAPADSRFATKRSFELAGRRWEPFATLPEEESCGRPLRVWRSLKLG